MKSSPLLLAIIPWARHAPSRDARKLKLGEKRTKQINSLNKRLLEGRFSGDVRVAPAFGVKHRKPELGCFGAKYGVDMRVQTNRRQDLNLTSSINDFTFNNGNDLIPFMAIKAWKQMPIKSAVQPYVKNQLDPPEIVKHDLKATLDTFYTGQVEQTQKPFAYSIQPHEHQLVSSLSSSLFKTYSLENASRKQLQKFNVQRMVDIFSKKDGDTGAPEVQGT
jgi:hypothetical protein